MQRLCAVYTQLNMADFSCDEVIIGRKTDTKNLFSEDIITNNKTL